MKVLVACEESQRVTIELRKLGNEAYSCDLLDCSGNHPEWHIKKDVTLLLNGNCIFSTVDGVEHEISGKWDMIIAFPPCTYLTVTGNRCFNYEKYGDKAIQRMLDRNDAIKFFMRIANADCDRIAIENPVGVMSTQWRKPDQIIQPYQYGDAYEKRTCLWLKGLPMLSPTKIVETPDRIQFKSGKTMAKWYVQAGNLSKEQRALVRSKTFPGVAKAMATQWGMLETSETEETEEIEDFDKTTPCDTIETIPHVDVDCSNLKKVPKNWLYGMFGGYPSISEMYNDKCFCCLADRKGNECKGKETCGKTWKRYEAIINPEWHHVNLATLANIDFDMLDKKRQVYLKAHRELKRTLADLSKCKTGHTYEARARKFMRDMISQYYDNEISYAMRKYLDLQLSMSNVVNGVWSSYVEPATGLHESRRYSRPTLTY
jgi:hypothetical protein